MKNLDVYLSVIVKVSIDDEVVPDALDRVLTDDWRASFYQMTSTDEAAEMLAYNCVANGIEDASLLDGWGEIEKGRVTMTVTGSELDWVS